MPFLSPGDLPGPGVEPTSPALAGGFLTRESREALHVLRASDQVSVSTSGSREPQLLLLVLQPSADFLTTLTDSYSTHEFISEQKEKVHSESQKSFFSVPELN